MRTGGPYLGWPPGVDAPGGLRQVPAGRGRSQHAGTVVRRPCHLRPTQAGCGAPRTELYSRAMTRDELLLAALAEGDASTVALAGATGLSERTCRYGLAHLVKTGHVWSPERGRWRLTDAGRAIAGTLDEPASAADEAGPGATNIPTTERGGPSVVDDTPSLRIEPAPGSQAAGQPPTGDETAQPGEGGRSVPDWLGWGLGMLAVGVVALVYGAARLPPAAQPEASPPPAMPTGWPYNGWERWGQ